jgi:beta-glucosidase
VKNTGKRPGTEIAEFFVQIPGENYKRLAGWQRVTLAPGESRAANISIDSRLLSTFDTSTHSWLRPHGDFQYFAGSSSRDLPLRTQISRP